MYSDLIPEDLLTKANTHTFSDREKKRREQASENKDYYYSNTEKYVDKPTDETDPVTINFLEPIVSKKTSLLYKNHIKRYYEGSSDSISFIEEFYNRIEIDKFLKHVDLAAELTGTGLVHIGIDEEDIKLYLYDGSEISVVARGPDNRKLDAASICSIDSVLEKPSNQVKQVLTAQVWTEDEIFTLQDGRKRQSVKNELGWLPFVGFRGKEVLNQYLGHAPAKSIKQLNKYLNQQVTNLGYMVKVQSFTPIVVTGFENGDSINVHPGRAIALPNGASAGVLNLNPQIKDTLELIHWIEDKIYETSSIPKISIVGDAKANSGKELLIKWYPIIEILNDKILRYETYELELANAILRLVDREPLDSLKLDINKEQILPFSPDDDVLEQDIKFALKTPVDELMQRDPSLDVEDATEIINNNKQFNSDFLDGNHDINKDINDDINTDINGDNKED